MSCSSDGYLMEVIFAEPYSGLTGQKLFGGGFRAEGSLRELSTCSSRVGCVTLHSRKRRIV